MEFCKIICKLYENFQNIINILQCIILYVEFFLQPKYESNYWFVEYFS